MKPIIALAFTAFCAPAVASDYLGILKPPQSGFTPTLFYSFASAPAPGFPVLAGPENNYRFKLGYQYSRYLAVEGEFSDFARPSDMFANPASLASAFRGTGFGVDTVATLPVWRLSFYGRMGAYRGERNGLSPYTTSLLGDGAVRGTRWRYGLGMRYDVTKTLDIRAELERHSLGIGSPLAGDIDADQVSVGVSWRF